MFNVYGIWEALELEGKVDTKKNTMVIAYLFQALPEELTLQVAHHTKAADIWKDLKARFVGIDKVKEARLQTLESEFETLKMKDSESLMNSPERLVNSCHKQAILDPQLKTKDWFENF
ncbi:hypothetical protein CTI12_AA003490 [Artemisia annua]|uniref:Zinc finger, CCHC-type n=1 Tax=Artemisia annua TaxID=35608 RepID=A0A2U1QP58_ARTAN|nr:hypothetical protein CTI12_AA003490 [Artemisia annua]